MATPNYSIHAITAFYLLSFAPQVYSTILINRATNGRFNTVNPRGSSSFESYQKSCDKATYARFERARAAHANALENLPLFAAAVICANIARLDYGTVNMICGVFLGLRALHSVLYIAIENRRLAYARSVVFSGSA
ncbi:hypothetical protein P7C71_g3714, partial [Lecanoromycetidae sp. Uapishka_2]